LSDTGLVRDNAGLVRDNAGLVRDNAGLVRDNAGLVRDNAGLVRDNAGLVRDNARLVRENTRLVRDNAGLVTPVTPFFAFLRLDSSVAWVAGPPAKRQMGGFVTNLGGFVPFFSIWRNSCSLTMVLERGVNSHVAAGALNLHQPLKIVSKS
jgi:hypothetical protein